MVSFIVPPQPFVDECLAKGAMTEAVKYIPKCLPDTRVSYYCDAGYVGGRSMAIDAP
jgi:hypothetical protein